MSDSFTVLKVPDSLLLELDLENEISVDPDFVITLEPHESVQPTEGYSDGFE